MAESKTSRSQEWPRTVWEAAARVVSNLSEKNKEMIRSTPEDRVLRFHHKLGFGIRNGFGLWSNENPALIKACQEMGDINSSFADDLSGVIIKAVWNYLNDLPIEHHQKAIYDTYPCELCSGEAQVKRWQEDEFTPPRKVLCRECARVTSPEYLQEQEQIRQNNIAVNTHFKKARQLGVFINRTYVAATIDKPNDGRSRAITADAYLLRLAQELYISNLEFRYLWDEVKGERPQASHLPWLRHWKKV